MTYEILVSLDMLINGETYRQDCFKIIEDEEKECANDLLTNFEEYMEGIKKSIIEIYGKRKDKEERELGEGKFEEITTKEAVEEKMDYEDFVDKFQREMEEETKKCQQNIIYDQNNIKEQESPMNELPEEMNEATRKSQQNIKYN